MWTTSVSNFALIDPVYNLVTLYAKHSGTYERFRTNRSVRSAISNLLHRRQARHGYLGTIDTNSNEEFTPREYCCLLQALLDGTLPPAQYFCRMLPYQLVSALRHRVDHANQMRFEYIVQRLDPHDVNLRMYWMILESDIILDIATEAWGNLFDYTTSLRAALSDEQFHYPVIIVRNAVRRHAPYWATWANELAGSVVQSQRSTRMETIRRRNTSASPYIRCYYTL